MEGAVRVIEGVFLGGQQAAVNSRFLSSNKITLIVNCAPLEVKAECRRAFCFELDLNRSGSLLQHYREIASLVEANLEKAEAVLIHCDTGASRSVGAFVAFLMCKFQWTLAYALEWLSVAYPYFELEPAVLSQLHRIQAEIPPALIKSALQTEEEILLINTVWNTKTSAASSPKTSRRSQCKVVWSSLRRLSPVPTPRVHQQSELKSILKGSPTWKQQVTRPRRTDSGSTLDSLISPVTGKKTGPGRAFLIGFFKSRGRLLKKDSE